MKTKSFTYPFCYSKLFSLQEAICYMPPCPAREIITVTQSDGTRLKIRIYGDEYYHYTISEEGYTLTSGSDGDYYYATLSPNGQLASTGVKARPMGKLSNSERQQLGQGFTQGLRPLSPTAHKQQMMRSAQNKSNSSNTRQ